MGRSRGGLTSKIHAVVDTNGLPVRLGLTAGEAHDNRLALQTLVSASDRDQCCWPTVDTTPTGSEPLPPRRACLGQRPAADAIAREPDLLQPEAMILGSKTPPAQLNGQSQTGPILK